MPKNSGSLEKIKKDIPKIKSAISNLGYEVTPGDVSVKTGLPILDIEYVLKELVAKYYGEIKVSNDGDIVYAFPNKFSKNRNGINKKLKKALGYLYKGFQVVYKASIMVILIFYFVLFLVIFLLLMFAGRSGDNNSGGGNRRGGGFNIFFWMWALGGDRRRHNDRYIDTAESNKPKKPFYKSVFDFVFGEDNPNQFLYNNMSKIVARFIQSKEGAIIPQELSPITATEFQNSSIEVSKYVGKFESEPEVTDDGTIILTFPKLLTSKAKQILSDKKFFARSKAYYEVPMKHNGNTSGSNIAMCAFNTFNLIMSGIIFIGPEALIGNIVGSIAARGETLSSEIVVLINFILSDAGYFFLGIFPFTFSLLFFIIPSLRVFYIKVQNKKIRERNLYKAVATAIIDKNNTEIRPDTLILPQEAHFYLENYTDDDIDRILNDMALSSACEVKYDESGNKIYDFSVLKKHLKDVRKYRDNNIIGKRISNKDIDFSTEDDLLDLDFKDL